MFSHTVPKFVIYNIMDCNRYQEKIPKITFSFDFFHLFLTESEGVELGFLEEVGSSDCHCVRTLLIVIRIQHEI